MDNQLLLDFENLKISAFSKYSKLRGDVHNVTIGPESIKFLDNNKNETKTPKVREKNEIKVVKSPERSSVPLTQLLKEFENQRREKVQTAIDDHFSKFNNFSKCKKEEKENQWLLKQQAFIKSVHEYERAIIETASVPDTNKTIQNEKFKKQYQEMLQRKLQYEQQLEKNKEKQRILNENIEQIKKYQTEFRTVYQEINAIIKACTSNEELKLMLGGNAKLLKTLPEAFEDITAKCKSHNISEEIVTKSADVLCQIKNLKLEIEDAVNAINVKKEETAKLAVEEAKATIATLNQCVSPNNLKKYVEIKEFLTQHSELFRELMNDEKLKQFRFDCKKAVNIPVNAISSVNSEHVKDKYLKLNNLLSGRTIVVADKQINASRHPQGISFCMDMLAKKFVLQGDLMISSNPDAAFCYATIIISLWNDFPDFGRLLLAYLYVQCPYLVPFYIPKTENQTMEEYYTALGYHYVDGHIEKQDKFLKRMTGILRLYFAITIAKPKRDQAKNPHDIKNAWNFLASLLKLEPQLDITATSLHIFLETVGFEMEAVYGAAFKKVIRIIIEKFIPIVKKIDTGGPVTRLEVLLQDYTKKGHFEKPKGILSVNFW